MKTCSKCKETKPLDSFYKKKGGPQGRESRCKDCQRSRNRGDVRRRLLAYKYGVTEEWFNSQNEKQSGVCASCGQPETRKNTTNLAVDHDHETREIRELLCQRCNTALGLLQDDAEVIEKLLIYRKKFL